jgi:hypothetical protein
VTWHEQWRDPFTELAELQERLVDLGAIVRFGGDFDAWDLEVRGGTLAGVRVTTLVEEHGQGRRLVRALCRPTWSRPALLMALVLAVLTTVAAADGALVAAVLLGLVAVSFGLRIVSEASSAMSSALTALASTDDSAAGA